MNAEQYLKLEFQVQPSMFREVASFLSTPGNRDNVLNPSAYLISSGHVDVIGDVTLKPIRVSKGMAYFVSKPGCKDGPVQPTESMAVWAWLSGKSVPSIKSNPLIDNVAFDKKSKDWEADTQVSDGSWISWLAEIDFMVALWKNHRATNDYELLTEQDKHFIDSIGLMHKVLRKYALSKLHELGFSMEDKNTRDILAARHADVSKDRRSFYPRFQHFLTPVFRFKVKELLSI